MASKSKQARVADIAARVASKTNGSGQIPATVAILNLLDPSDRAAWVAYLDELPDGTQKAAVARALNEDAEAAGYTGPKINADMIRRFMEGSRYGLQT